MNEQELTRRAFYFTQSVIYQAEMGRLCGVRFFFQQDPRAFTAQFHRPFRLAAGLGHVRVVQFLLDHGADVHALFDCALRWSAGHGHLHMVRFLVTRGADVCALDNSPLRAAAQRGHLFIVQYLLEQGADIQSIMFPIFQDHPSIHHYIKHVSRT